MVALLQDQTGVFTVVGALIAILGGVLGSLLSGWLTTTEAKRSWERQKELRNYDERRQAYVDLMRASWHLYRKIDDVNRELDHLRNEYDNSKAKQTVAELKELTARLRDDVFRETMRAFDNALVIRLLSSNKHMDDAAEDLAVACRALQDYTSNRVSQMLSKVDRSLEGPVEPEYQADQNKDVLKKQFLEKQRHFINTGRDDLLGV